MFFTPLLQGSTQLQSSTTVNLVRRLTSTGNLLVNGYFDEVTKSTQSIDSVGIQYSAEFDEYSTITPSIQRYTTTGGIIVAGEFDEVTKAT